MLNFGKSLFLLLLFQSANPSPQSHPAVPPAASPSTSPAEAPLPTISALVSSSPSTGPTDDRVFATPLAKRLAAEKGLDLTVRPITCFYRVMNILTR